MTKGVVTGESTRNAEYSVRLEFDLRQARAISDRLKQQLIDYVQPILDAEVELIELDNKIQTKANEVDRAIIDAQAGATEESGPPPPETEIVSKLMKELARLNAQRITKRSNLAIAKLKRAQTAKAKTSIDNALAADNFNATPMFCADYTTDLQAGAEVGVCLVPGENTGATLTIYPAYMESDDGSEPAKAAKWEAEKFGQLVPPYSMTPESCFYNWALLGGWQRWMPTFRHATITKINKEANTANVEVDNSKSSLTRFVGGAGSVGLRVNETNALPYRMEGVAIKYMDCDCDAFRVGDRVIIEFTERIVREKKIYQTSDSPPRFIPVEEIETPAWQQGNSRIIGFIENPRVCPIVIESGFVDYRNIDNDSAGVLHPTEAVFDATGDSPSFLDGDMSNDSEPPRNYASGIDSISAPSGGKGLAKFNGLNASNPANCTGKLRLAVQAQYGSTSGNQSLFQFAERNTASKTWALYTSDDYDYFILKISRGSITAQKINIPNPAQYTELYKELQAGGNRQSKAESYFFSRAKLGALEISEEFDAIKGSPIGGDSTNGWSANWSGDKLVIATNEAVFPGQGTLPLYQTQRLYRLNISINKSVDDGGKTNYSLSATNELLEQKNCTPRNNKTIVWYPVIELGVMKAHIWTPVSGYAEGLVGVDGAPLQAFYAHYADGGGDPEDRLVIFRHHMETNLSDGVSVNDLITLRSDWLEGQTICGLSDATLAGENEWSLNYNIEGVHVTIDDDVVSPKLGLKSADLVYSAKFDLALEEYDSATFDPNAKPGFSELSAPGYCGDLITPSWDDGRWRTTVFGSNRILYLSRSNIANVTGESIVIIPFAGVDAAYLGTLEGFNGFFDVDHTSREIVSRYESTLTGEINASKFAANGTGGATGTSVSASGSSTPLEFDDDDRYEQKYDVRFTLYSRGGEQDSYELSVESIDYIAQAGATESAKSKLGSWDAWFNPPLFVDPTIERVLLVQESAGYNSLVYTFDPTVDFIDETKITDDGLPEDLEPVDNGPFSGWA